MWGLIKSKFKQPQRETSEALSSYSRDDELRYQIRCVVSDNFGVHIEPVFDMSVACFTMKIMPDEAIEQMQGRYREPFIHAVNNVSHYMYEALQIDSLLQSFMGEIFNYELQKKMELIIEDLIIMHERVMERTFVDFITDVTMYYINNKVFV